MGGGGGTALGTSAMRALPIGVPKVMVHHRLRRQSGPIRRLSGTVMMPSVVDVAGVNRISRLIFANAAAAICGMVYGLEDAPGRPASAAHRRLDVWQHDARVNHARAHGGSGATRCWSSTTGTAAATMERLIEEGYFAGVLDITRPSRPTNSAAAF